MPPRPLHHLSDLLEVICIVKFLDHGGPELIVGLSFLEELDTLKDTGHREAVLTYRLRVLCRAVLHIHRHVIREPVRKDRAEEPRVVSVRVQLHRVAHFLYFPKELRELPVDAGLAARDRDAVEQSLPLS